MQKNKSGGTRRIAAGLVFLFIVIVLGAFWFSKRGRDIDIILLTLDTTRWDYVDPYRESDPVTPNLGRLAARGVTFIDAVSVVPLTLPAHASLFTGLYPNGHGVRNNGEYILPEDVITLAEILSDNGYTTAGLISSFVLDSRFGLDRGFGFYDDEIEALDHSGGDFSRMNLAAERDAREVTDRAIEWLSSSRESPFFLWVHYYDPHYPYRPPSPFDERFPDDPYTGEIAYMDHELGRLLSFVLSGNRSRRTAVIAVSDHGESLGEHGEMTHGLFLYESAIRIPLIMLLPGVTEAGAKVEATARITDIMPTLIDYLHIDAPADLDGSSLIPVLENQKKETAGVVAESLYPKLSFGWSPIFCLRRDGYKYIKAPKPELYDIGKDPLENRNLIGEFPDLEKEMSLTLESYITRSGAREAADGSGSSIDAETAAKLRSLGYLSHGGTGAGDTLRDPKDMVEVKRLLTEAQFLMNDGRLWDALGIFRKVTSVDPLNPSPYNQIGLIYFRLDVPDSALFFLERAAELDSTTYNTHHNLAAVYESLGRTELAADEYRKAIALNPSSVEDLQALGNLLSSQGEFNDALGLYQEAQRLADDDPGTYHGIAEVFMNMGRYQDAVDILEDGIVSCPPSAALHNKLGTIYQRLGDTSSALAEYERALTIDPNHLDAIYNRATVRTERGSLESALSDLTKLLSHPDYEARVDYSIAVIHEMRGEREEAIDSYSKFLSLYDGDPAIGADVRERIERLRK